MADRNRIVQRYDEARALVRKREGRELTPKEYLDTVAPGKRNTKSARDYIRRLRSGERSGTRLAERAQNVSGKTVRVDYKVGKYTDEKTGETVDDIRSQNVLIPARKSRLDFYRDDLRDTVDRGLQESYSRRKTAPTPRKDDPKYVPLARLPEGAEIVSVHRSRRSRKHAIVLRDAP